MARLATADVAHDLPLCMLRKLRGTGTGMRADAPEKNGKKKPEPRCLLSEDTGVHDATTVRTGLRPSQADQRAWNCRRFNKAKVGRACPVLTHEKTKGQQETAPASLRFAPSALVDKEDERAAVEAAQAVAVAVLRQRSGPASNCLWRLTVEHCALPGRTRHWLQARAPDMICKGDEVGRLTDVTLSFEEATLFHRGLRAGLDDAGDGDAQRLAEARDAEGAGGVAGDDDELCALGEEEAGEFLTVTLDGGLALAAVRDARGVADVEDALRGEKLAERRDDGEAANAGIKNADGARSFSGRGLAGGGFFHGENGAR